MWKPRPGKWLLWAPPMVVMTTLAAHMLNTGALTRDISARTTEQLFAIGANWAAASLNGRDVTLTGDAPSQQAIDSAVKALAGTYGVRTVATRARIVVPVVLTPPTIESLIANSSTPEIKGKWQEGVAKTLAVTLAGKTYKFGTDPEIASNAGAWALKPSVPLADGSYDVTAEVSDGVNPAVGSTAPAKLVIDTVAPAAPAITPVASGIQWPFTLNGTWVEDGATSLIAKLADQTWTLGKDEDLKSDGKGNWSFAPVVDLRPGTYDITLETSDRGWKYFESHTCGGNRNSRAGNSRGRSHSRSSYGDHRRADAQIRHHHGSPANPCRHLARRGGHRTFSNFGRQNLCLGHGCRTLVRWRGKLETQIRVRIERWDLRRCCGNQERCGQSIGNHVNDRCRCSRPGNAHDFALRRGYHAIRNYGNLG